MASKRPRKPELDKWYRGADIPMRVIRDFARRVAERFQPEKIILFGSYAYGTPHEDSDVDILVVMPARNELDQSVRIELACESYFPLDIIVRTPKNMAWRLEEGDSFLREIVTRGKVLYEKDDTRVGDKSGERLRRGRGTRPEQRPAPWRGLLPLPAERGEIPKGSVGRTGPSDLPHPHPSRLADSAAPPLCFAAAFAARFDLSDALCDRPSLSWL
jgi:predicted nucleotidyltransferase